MALYKGERRLTSLQWHQATSIEVRFRGHKGDQAQQGSVIVRTRDDASGTRSGVGASGGAVALVVVDSVGISDDAGKRPLVVVSVW